MTLTLERLKELLYYDPETGIFTWLVNKGSALCGEPAGRKTTYYVQIKVDRKPYMAHRLAWFYMTGNWPENQIDHIDRQKSNNKFSNLREATGSQNRANCGALSNNKLGVKGVFIDQGRYRASIQLNRKRIFLGPFDTIEKATTAYENAALEIHGEFARTS